MRFRILGPLEVQVDGGWSGINAPKWRTVLAVLLLQAGEVVSTDQLINEVWPEQPAGRQQPDQRLRLTAAQADRRPGGQGAGDPLPRLPAAGRRPTTSTRAGSPGWPPRAGRPCPPGTARARPTCSARPSACGRAAGRWPTFPLAAGQRRGQPAGGSPGRGAGAAHQRRPRPAAARRRWWPSCAGCSPITRSARACGPCSCARCTARAGRRRPWRRYAQAREVIADELGVDPSAELRQLHQQMLQADAGSGSPIRNENRRGGLPLRRCRPGRRPAVRGHSARARGASPAAMTAAVTGPPARARCPPRGAAAAGRPAAGGHPGLHRPR